MSDLRSPSRWSCIALGYAGLSGSRKATRPVETAGYSRLPASKVNELSIVHVGSEF